MAQNGFRRLYRLLDDLVHLFATAEFERDVALFAGCQEGRIVSMSTNALRSAASRSAGTPGVVRIERPISAVLATARSTLLPSSVWPSSGNVGTFGSSRFRLSAAW